MDALQIVIIITGLIGQLLVARRNKLGFYFWIVGNCALSVVFWQSEKYGLIALHAVYSAIQVYSIWHWGARSARRERPEFCV